MTALKNDVKELRPLTHKLQTSCEHLQMEVNSLKKEIEEIRIEMKRMLVGNHQISGQQCEEDVSLEELNHQQVSDAQHKAAATRIGT